MDSQVEPAPHPSVWTSNMLVLAMVVFSAAYGIGRTLFKAEGEAGSDDDD